MTETSPSEAAHADYGASSMERWTSCLGSPRLCADLPSYDTEWSADGSTAHGLMHHCLLFRERDATNFVDVIVEPIQGKRFGPIVHEQARNVQVILDYIYEILDRYPDAILSVEHRVHIPSSAVPGRMWGTCDVRIYVPSIRWLFVIDYKHGVGIFVDINENKQLMFYGTGALWECIQNDQAVQGITLSIVQPRSFSDAAGGIRDKDFTPADLFAFHSEAERAAYATLDPAAPLVPSPDNCRWCAAGAAGRCPAVERKAVTLVGQEIRQITAASLPDPKTLSFETMLAVLDARKLLVGWMKSVYECAVGYARAGNSFPQRKMVWTAAKRVWDEQTHKGDDIAQQLSIYTGRALDEVYPRQLVGITEAENAMVDAFRSAIVREPGESKKAFTARQNKASELARHTMAMLTIKKPGGGMELVPLSDPRPAIDNATALFNNVNMEGL